MIKIHAHEYTLVAKNSLNAGASSKVRSGALLRISWSADLTGYADLFPWPEFGDDTVDNQLLALAQGRITSAVEQSMWCARRDANARRSKLSGFSGLPKVKNHFLILDYTTVSDNDLNEIKKSGFSTLKIKMGRDVLEEIEWVARVITQFSFVVRLDFNAMADFTLFEKALSILKPAAKARIDFVEDPFPYEEEAWGEAAKLVPLAIDQEQSKLTWAAEKKKWPFKVLVVKPARQDIQIAADRALLHDLNIVVTSNLDHPVGVAHALWVAGEMKKKYPYRVFDAGCLSLGAYQVNEFYSGLMFQGPYLMKGTGMGIGFDHLWEKLSWKQIR